jgi:uncharacterized coiled-coil protein SlyX
MSRSIPDGEVHDAVSDNGPHDERLVKIELLLMQLQHDVDQLSKVLLDQQGEIDSLRRAMEQLASAVEDNVAEPRSPEEERPPHY